MEEEQFFKEKPESNLFKQVIYKYLPFWPLFVITVSISLFVSLINLRSQIPIFVAQATVLLKDPNKGSGDSKVLDALNIFSEKKIVENEIMVMRSSDINQQVARELELYAAVYNKGNVRVEELYKENSPVQFKALNEATLNSYALYFFTMDWVKKKVLIDNKSVSFDSIVLLDNNYYKIFVNKAYNTAATGKNFYVQFLPVAAAAGNIIGSISANPLSAVSTIINVQMQTPVAQKGQDILTKLFEIYNRKAIEDKNQIALRTLNFVEDRLRTVMSQLDSVERNIASYKSRESIVDMGTQASSYFNNVTGLDKRNGELDLQLSMLKDINSYIHNKGG
ncbi:MAG: hypothetical protein ABIO55_05755, partial [Ginsengibacter sp.]